MTVAIYREGQISAKSKKDRFKQCLQIAKEKCREYGFVVFAGSGLDEAIGLTPKGRKQDMKHRREGRAKNVLFDTLFKQFDIDGTKAAADKKAKEAEAAKIAAAKATKK